MYAIAIGPVENQWMTRKKNILKNCEKWEKVEPAPTAAAVAPPAAAPAAPKSYFTTLKKPKKAISSS